MRRWWIQVRALHLGRQSLPFGVRRISKPTDLPPEERNHTVQLRARRAQVFWHPLGVVAGVMVAYAPTAHADAALPVAKSALAAKQKEEKQTTESPWLLVPTLSANPKLGTSVGGMAGYMYYFDPQSKVSLFGTSAQYTSTGSLIVRCSPNYRLALTTTVCSRPAPVATSRTTMRIS